MSYTGRHEGLAGTRGCHPLLFYLKPTGRQLAVRSCRGSDTAMRDQRLNATPFMKSLIFFDAQLNALGCDWEVKY